MGFNNPSVRWSEMARLLGSPDIGGDSQPDGGDGPAFSRKRGKYEPPPIERPADAVPYAELHAHSSFSFLDGASSPAELAEEAAGSAAKLAKDILSEKDSLGRSLESVTYEKTDRYLNQLSAHLDYLGVIIGLSPMLGLLGTITGMMGTFSSMTGQLQNTAGVTAGLAEALITTIFGLVIAIAGMLVHAYLNARYKKAMLDLDAVADALISGLSGK